MVLKEVERMAIRNKLSDPEKAVKCPRCGKELRYEEKGDSRVVICPTPRCIVGGERGI